MPLQLIINSDDITTALDAAKILGVHFVTVYRWMKNGKLHSIPIGGQNYLSIDEIRALKDKRRNAK